MAEPVPPTNPHGEVVPPTLPSFANNPVPTSSPSEPTPPTLDPPPLPPPANDVYRGPGAMPDLTVAQSPFPGGTNTPPPNPTDPPVMVRGEANFAAPASGAGVTTATILPTSSSEPEMISFPSSRGGGRNLLLPIIIGVLVLLVVLAGGFLFFSQSREETTDNTDTVTQEPTPEPTEEPQTAQVLPTISYDNNEFNFTLDYPQGWDVKEGLNGNVVVFSDPLTVSGPTPSRVTIRVETTLSDLTTYNQQQQRIYSQLYTGWVNVTTNQTTLGVTPAVEVESTYTKGINTVLVLQLILIQGGKAYLISTEAEGTAFENLRPTYTQILASLKFKS